MVRCRGNAKRWGRSRRRRTSLDAQRLPRTAEDQVGADLGVARACRCPWRRPSTMRIWSPRPRLAYREVAVAAGLLDANERAGDLQPSAARAGPQPGQDCRSSVWPSAHRPACASSQTVGCDEGRRRPAQGDRRAHATQRPDPLLCVVRTGAAAAPSRAVWVVARSPVAPLAGLPLPPVPVMWLVRAVVNLPRARCCPAAAVARRRPPPAGQAGPLGPGVPRPPPPGRLAPSIQGQPSAGACTRPGPAGLTRRARTAPPPGFEGPVAGWDATIDNGGGRVVRRTAPRGPRPALRPATVWPPRRPVGRSAQDPLGLAGDVFASLLALVVRDGFRRPLRRSGCRSAGLRRSRTWRRCSWRCGTGRPGTCCRPRCRGGGEVPQAVGVAPPGSVRPLLVVAPGISGGRPP